MSPVFSVPLHGRRAKGEGATTRPHACRPEGEHRPWSRRFVPFLMGASALFGLTGCHAPKPSFNFLAPYGSPTVPPPPTGAVGTSPDYYASPQSSSGKQEGGTPAPPNAGSSSAPSGQSSESAPNTPSNTPGTSRESGTRLQMGAPPGRFMGTENRSDSGGEEREYGVKPASYQAGTPSSRARLSDDSRSTGSSTLKLDAMPVNEATSATPAATASNAEPTRLSELPDASPISSSLQTITPGAAYASRTRQGQSPAPLATPAGSRWQTR